MGAVLGIILITAHGFWTGLSKLKQSGVPEDDPSEFECGAACKCSCTRVMRYAEDGISGILNLQLMTIMFWFASSVLESSNCESDIESCKAKAYAFCAAGVICFLFEAVYYYYKTLKEFLPQYYSEELFYYTAGAYF